MTIDTPDTPQTITKPLSELPTPPGSDGLPYIGHTLDFFNDPRGLVDKLRAKTGSEVFYANLLGSKTVFMLGSAANQWVYSGEDKYLYNKWSYGVETLLGVHNISTLTGDAHRERRAQVQPRFKFEAMKDFLPMIHDTACKHMAEWIKKDDIIIVHAVRDMLFEVIAHFIFSEDVPKLDLSYMSQQFQIWEKGLFSVPFWNLPFLPFGKAIAAQTKLKAYLGDLIRQRRESGRTPDDVLTTLIAARNKEGQPISDGDIIEEIQLMLFAGHDTGVTSISNLILLFSQNPATLGKARAEQQTVPEEALHTLEGLKTALPYLDACINESLRMIPPIAQVARATKHDVEFQGYRIPAGWKVAIAPTIIHHDHAIYPDPDVFNPDRILEGQHKAHPHSHIPFSSGPRLCIGMNFATTEMRIVLSLMLRDHTWDLLPDQDLSYNLIPFPLPKSGIKVRFRKL